MSRSEIAQLIGVYDANGGVRGEAAYVIGKMLGRRHCALCDITHSPLRRKPAWDAFVGELGLLVRLAHLNELSVAEAAIIERVGAPAVLALTADGSLTVLLDAESLEEAGGSVDGFAELVRRALDDEAAN